MYVEAIKPSFTRDEKSETSWKLQWNSFVYFTINKVNVESRQNNVQQKGKTERDANWQEQGWKFYLLLVLAVVLASMHGLCLYSMYYTTTTTNNNTVITLPSSP